MTETQGDYLGCLIVLIGLIPMLIGVQRASDGNPQAMRPYAIASGVLSVIGVVVVIVT